LKVLNVQLIMMTSVSM